MRAFLSLLRAIWGEAVGLFIDDGRFAAFILAWLVFAVLALPRLLPHSPAAPLLLFAGLALILVDSAVRRARRG